MKAAYLAYLSRILGQSYVRGHAGFANAWWKSRIVGGMFRAGVRWGRRNPASKYDAAETAVKKATA